MPCDMAMEGPDTWIVGDYLNGDVPRWRQQLYVSAGWVTGIALNLSVPGADTLRQYEHVVTVDMHWVGNWVLVVHNNDKGLVGAEVVDIPFAREGGNCGRGIGDLEIGKDGVIVIGAE